MRLPTSWSSLPSSKGLPPWIRSTYSPSSVWSRIADRSLLDPAATVFRTTLPRRSMPSPADEMFQEQSPLLLPGHDQVEAAKRRPPAWQFSHGRVDAVHEPLASGGPDRLGACHQGPAEREGVDASGPRLRLSQLGPQDG